MPIYEYECSSCRHRFDLRQGFFDSSVVDCPRCAGTSKRLFNSSFTVVYKGSGFYTTDYARKSYSGGNGQKAEDTPGKEAAKAQEPKDSKEPEKAAASEPTASKKD